MNRRPKQLTAFTLIEVMLAVVVLGLLATAAVLGFAGPVRSAQLRQAIDRIHDADANARIAARNFNRDVPLDFDLALPGSARIDAVRTSAGEISVDDAAISISPLGLSPSYALRIVSGGSEPFWLVFSGLTGQMKQISDESKVRDILQSRGQ